MFSMLLNHIATIFLSSGTWLCESFLAIGYFTAITMTYFLVEGYHYTHSKKIYILRLFVFALISEIPYCFAFTTNSIIEFYGFNMLFTLCICFGILYILDTIKNRFAKVCLIILAVMFFAGILNTVTAFVFLAVISYFAELLYRMYVARKILRKEILILILIHYHMTILTA